MGVTRDTSGDDAAEATRAKQRTVDFGPPHALSGWGIHTLRKSVDEACALLAEIEGRTKAWGEKRKIRAVREDLRASISMLPADHAKRSTS